MKKLKFVDKSIKEILSGEKLVTWRMFDEKGLSARDTLSLCDTNGKEFSKARIISVKEKPLSEITDKEKEEAGWGGKMDIEIRQKYSEHYKKPIEKNTEVKIIGFKVI